MVDWIPNAAGHSNQQRNPYLVGHRRPMGCCRRAMTFCCEYFVLFPVYLPWNGSIESPPSAIGCTRNWQVAFVFLLLVRMDNCLQFPNAFRFFAVSVKPSVSHISNGLRAIPFRISNVRFEMTVRFVFHANFFLLNWTLPRVNNQNSWKNRAKSCEMD